MERFPALRLIVRHGAAGAAVLAGLVAALVLALAWPFWGAIGLLPALGAGGLAYGLARSYVELVVLITEMLMPQ